MISPRFSDRSISRAAVCLRIICTPARSRMNDTRSSPRVMHQANLEAVQRMAHGQQLEAAEVRRQDERTLAGVPRRQLVPNVQPIVGDAPRDPAIEESAETNVFGARAAKVDVRRA
jgi:hypothetical protein